MRKNAFILVMIVAIGMFACERPKPDMPSFNILLRDSVTIFNTGNIPDGKPSVLIFFSPYCDHCKAETKSILKKIDSLQQVNFYFVTLQPMEEMREFYDFYHLSKYHNVTVGRDYTSSLPVYFEKVTPPSSFVYDKYKRLKAVFSGETKADSLLACINNL